MLIIIIISEKIGGRIDVEIRDIGYMAFGIDYLINGYMFWILGSPKKKCGGALISDSNVLLVAYCMDISILELYTRFLSHYVAVKL